jgi:nucleolar protein 14
VFYGFLIQHFAILSGATPLPVDHLDALTEILLALTSEVPFYAATVARARLTRIHDSLAAALRNRIQSESSGSSGSGSSGSSGWPQPRALLQLKLFASLFPVTDRRHPVTSPLMILVAKALNQCVVMDGWEAGLGLCYASLALHGSVGE